jgi:hypothetical protein
LRRKANHGAIFGGGPQGRVGMLVENEPREIHAFVPFSTVDFSRPGKGVISAFAIRFDRQTLHGCNLLPHSHKAQKKPFLMSGFKKRPATPGYLQLPAQTLRSQ